MTIFTSIVVFVVIWWLVFFITLPIGSKSYYEAGEESEVGHVESAPLKPRIWMKMLASTGIAAVIWLVIFFLVRSGALSFRP